MNINAQRQRLKALQRSVVRIRGTVTRLRTADTRFSLYRGIVFFGGVGLGIALYFVFNRAAGWSCIAVSLIFFFILVWRHRRVSRSIERFSTLLSLQERSVHQVTRDWRHLVQNHETGPVDPSHPFEYDLQICGGKSLLSLIDCTISNKGKQCLKRWLTDENPQYGDTMRRQALVRELSVMTRFRNGLLLHYHSTVKERINTAYLEQWLGKTAITRFFTLYFLCACLLSIVTAVLLLLFLGSPSFPFWIISFAVYWIVYFLNAASFKMLLHDSVLLSRELYKMRTVLLYLEHYPYPRHSSLKTFCAPFLNKTTSPARRLRRLDLLETLVGLRMNPVLGVILNSIVPWDFFTALVLHAFKKRLALCLPLWTNTMAELEALFSLAHFSWLNPHYAFPSVTDPGAPHGTPMLHANHIGHPLIPAPENVPNDFLFDKKGDTALITGSNMSGKSTFLKTIGANVCLAYAGGPVNAEALQVSVFRLFACINISDSVTEGFSYFYAEVKRLRALLRMLEQQDEPPVLYVIDEIFRGTNNKERFAGSWSYIHAASRLNGNGLIATHDVSLTQLSEKMPHIRNYHFSEEIIGAAMRFDYLLKPGPCLTTNALKIMALEGLPVPDQNHLP